MTNLLCRKNGGMNYMYMEIPYVCKIDSNTYYTLKLYYLINIHIIFRLLVTVAAMAIPSVPSASIMTTIMILTSMNIPMEDIALLLAVEWYL